MKKFIATLLLVIVILATFGFVILRTQANGPENDFFNQNLRHKFARYQFFRQVLYLHSDGDAKSDYLGATYSKISIEVDTMAGLDIPKDSLDLLTAKMSAATGKQVSYFISDETIPYTKTLDIKDVDALATTYRNSRSTADTASLYLLYLSKLNDQNDQIGSTYKEDGIMVFAGTLQDYTIDGSDLFDKLVESTTLHEFGHQLGLVHNNYTDCIMQAYVEQSTGFLASPDNVITDFCNFEKSQIADIKSRL